MTQPRQNIRSDGGGAVAAVCELCGRQSPFGAPDATGEPALWTLPGGWSQTPFPAGHVHPDGSVGSLYACPACNARRR